MRNIKKLLALVLALVMVVCLAACNGNQGGNQDDTQGGNQGGTQLANPERYGGTFRWAWGQSPKNFDPYGVASFNNYEWCQNIYESALVRGADGKIYPLVCNYEANADWSEVKLSVREGVTFHDGSAVTMADVKASLERAKGFAGKTDANAFWDAIDTWTDNADGSVTIKFKAYNAKAQDFLCSPKSVNGHIMPKAICDKYGTDYIMDPKDVIGTGPYKLNAEKSELDLQFVMDKYDAYVPCMASADGNGLASPRYGYLKQLILQFNSDGNAKQMMLMSDELDRTETNTQTFKTTLEPLGYEFANFPAGSTAYTFFNCSEGRPTANKNLRKAIIAACDQMDMLHHVFGDDFTLEVDGPCVMGEAYSCARLYTEDYAASEANLELAKQYLEKAKAEGFDPATPLKVAVTSNMGTYFTEVLKPLGLTVEIFKTDNATLISYATNTAEDWDFIYRTNTASTSNPVNMFVNYYYPWGNAEAKALLDQMGAIPSHTEKGLELWADFLDLVAEECPWWCIGGNTENYCWNGEWNNNRQGVWRYVYNSYWDNPSEHENFFE